MIEFDKKENAVLTQSELKFYGITSLGCKIGLLPAGANTDDIITKHVHKSLFWFFNRL